MTDAAPSPQPTPADAPAAPASGVMQIASYMGFFAAIMTPTLVMYAIPSRPLAPLAFLGIVVVMALFFHPRSPLAIKNKVAGLVARIVLYGGVTAFLIVRHLPVWAGIYAVVTALVLILPRLKRAPSAE